MSFLVAGLCLLALDHLDYPDVFPSGWSSLLTNDLRVSTATSLYQSFP